MGVVQQRAQLPALQPIAAHIPLGVQEGHRGPLLKKSQQLTTPLKKNKKGGHSPNHSLGQVQVSKPEEVGRHFAKTQETCILEPSYLPQLTAMTMTELLLFTGTNKA